MNVSQISIANYRNNNFYSAKNLKTKKQDNSIEKDIINFQGRTQALEKPLIDSVSSQKLVNKISTYLKIMPENSKLTKPIFMKVEGHDVGFLVDKSNSEFSKVLVKTGVTSSNDWDKVNHRESVMDLLINKKGQISKGELTLQVPYDGYHIVYERFPRGRRINYNGVTYMPIETSGKELWSNVVTSNYEGFNKSLTFDDFSLGNIFRNLIGLNTSLLVL